MLKLYQCSVLNPVRIQIGRNFCQNISIKSNADIPGPIGCANILNYVPIIGKYSWDELHIAGLDKYVRYGPIVKEIFLPGVEVIWLFDPKDIATVLNDFGQDNFPMRRSHLALEKYRRDRTHIYKSGGLLPTNGPEWWRIRSELQKSLSSPKKIRNFVPEIDEITRTFCENIASNETIDILPELARLNLEIICLVAFDERINSFAQDERNPNSRSSMLIEAAETTNKCILPTDQGLQLWRYFNTPTYKQLTKAQLYMESVALDLVFRKVYALKSGDEKPSVKLSLLEEYLINPNLELSDVVGMAVDLLLAGVDTTTYSTCFVLYHLARNETAQQRLFEESLTILSDKVANITAENLKTFVPYTRAILKESLRMNPISIGVGRILNKDLLLNNYRVPSGSVVVTQNMISCRLSKYFESPDRFLPERWLDRNNNANPYLVLPFGHGMRACIARRLAEQNMIIAVLRLVNRYKIHWKGTNTMDVKTFLINKPDQPVRVLLEPR